MINVYMMYIFLSPPKKTYIYISLLVGYQPLLKSDPCSQKVQASPPWPMSRTSACDLPMTEMGIFHEETMVISTRFILDLCLFSW